MDQTSQPEPGRGQWIDDSMVSIRDIRALFELGRTAAYELTHRPEFPEPVVVSPRCYRWWASEVTAFARNLRCEGTRPRSQASHARHCDASLPNPPLHIEGIVRAARTRRTAL
jgi:predicted DNA-binding transcriptional regulator AlpA